MVEQSADALDETFRALADPTRRAILARLRDGPASVSELSDPFPMSLAGVSKHLRVLERAGLIRREVRGRQHRCSLEAGPLAHAAAWTEPYRDFWEGRLDALADYLERPRGGKRR